MNKNRALQLLSVIGMLLAVVAGGLAVSPAYAASSFVSFKAKVSGTVAFTGATTFEIAGAGKADHLAALKSFDYQADGVFTGPATDSLTETLTTANGDTLTILCNQMLEEVAPGVFHGTDTWTVIGGTGQFSGATGSGTGETEVDLNTGTISKVMKGDISAPYAD